MDVGADQEAGLLGQGQPPVEHQKQCLEEKAARKVSKVMNRNDTVNVRMIRTEIGGRQYPLCRRLRYSGSAELRIVYGLNIVVVRMKARFGGSRCRAAMFKQTRLSFLKFRDARLNPLSLEGTS